MSAGVERDRNAAKRLAIFEISDGALEIPLLTRDEVFAEQQADGGGPSHLAGGQLAEAARIDSENRPAPLEQLQHRQVRKDSFLAAIVRGYQHAARAQRWHQ